MKVLNYTTTYFAAILLILISIWAGIFYYAMLAEIYDSIDDGLDNQKGLIIQKAAVDSTILLKNNLEEDGHSIKEINYQSAKNIHDIYLDTMMYMQNEEDFEPVRLLRTVFHQNGKYYQMQVATSMVEEDDLMAELFIAVLWLYLGLVATILIINNILLKTIWRPFYHLLKQIKNFRLEKPSEIELQTTKIDEFKLLNESVQKLLKSNIDAYNNQKHFIENASHELQTPLAISINKLEALAESNTLSEKDLKLISSTLDHLERLTRLNKSLLLLSRIENKQFLIEEEININELVKRIADDFSDLVVYSEVALNIVEQDLLTAKMNPDLAVILITNLIKNAIVHNHKEGLATVIINEKSLQVENTSNEEALDEQKIFTRFNNHKKLESSTGLGLAIVKAIADLYGFEIAYTYKNKHIITVRFK